jgi:polyvinyl alcohol dehydrogenase (cytochrome)
VPVSHKRMPVLWCLAVVMACGGDVKKAEWSVAGQNLSNTRHQDAESRLNVGNVSGLAPRWSFTAGGDISATAAVESGAVYFPDWSGKLWKLEAGSGRVLWSRSISDYTGVPDSVSRTTPAVVGNRLILGSQEGGYLLALDKHSGALLWKTRLDPHPAAVITQSPIVFGEHVYVGVSSMEESFTADPSYVCCSFRGSVVSVSLETGALEWKTHMVPEGYSGGAVWSNTLVVDTKRHSLYVTTGNNYEVPAPVKDCLESNPPESAESCLAPDDYIDAFVALDLDTGAIKWGRRLQGFDAWNFACSLEPQDWCPSPVGPDYDFGQGVMLFTAGKRDLIGAGQKSGIFWALDPDTGAVVWSTLVGPGGSSGGIMWGSATDGTRLYVGNANWNHQPQTLVSGEQIAWGAWSALDPATGAILWQTSDPGHSLAMGPLTVANGVVYAGSMDAQGHMYALDAGSGKILWSHETGGSVNAGAAVVDGSVYWGSGYGRFGMGTPNNKFFAFSLK